MQNVFITELAATQPRFSASEVRINTGLSIMFYIDRARFSEMPWEGGEALTCTGQEWADMKTL